MNAEEVIAALRRRYGCEGDDGIGPEWACLDELERNGRGSERIDVLFVRAWSGRPKGHERHAVEVKVSRADLLRELKSGKWEPWAAIVHRFFLAVPADVNLDGLTLPDRWGIYTVDGRGPRQTRKAPRLDRPDDLPHRLFVEVFRRAGRAEARIRDGHVDDPATEIARLRRELDAATRQVDTARRAQDRSDNRARDALHLFAIATPDIRCRCGTPVRFARWRGSHATWGHVGDPGQVPDFRDGTHPCRYASIDLDQLADRLAEVTA